jgi:hypothetical protein
VDERRKSTLKLLNLDERGGKNVGNKKLRAYQERERGKG